MRQERLHDLLGLHQRQLRRRHGPRKGLHSDTGADALELRQVLANGVGAAGSGHRHDDEPGGGRTGILHYVCERRLKTNERPTPNCD